MGFRLTESFQQNAKRGESIRLYAARKYVYYIVEDQGPVFTRMARYCVPGPPSEGGQPAPSLKVAPHRDDLARWGVELQGTSSIIGEDWH